MRLTVRVPYSQLQLPDKRRAVLGSRHFLPGAVAFAATGGYVNSVAIGFFRSPVSHMTGTVSYFGLDLAAARWADAATSGSILGGFLAGAVLGGYLLGARKGGMGRRHGVTLLLEAALLGGCMALLLARQRTGLPLAAMACGLQNVMTSSYLGLMVRTTHVTGTVTDIGAMVGHWIRHRRIERWKLGFMIVLVFSFTLGVLLGGLADARWGPRAFGLPAAGLLVAGTALAFIPGARQAVERDLAGAPAPSQ